MSDVADDAGTPLGLGTGWSETHFERGTYGPNGVQGHRAELTLEASTVAVEPVRYGRDGHRERVELIAEGADGGVRHRETASSGADIDARIAFAVVVRYRPGERDREAVFTVTGDPDDALAAATWLTAETETPWEMERNLRLHRGEPTASTDVVVSDDDALRALFRSDADRCVFTGKPTRSHLLALPFRYVPLLRNRKVTDRGVFRVPSTVDGLRGAVSHEAWEDHDLAGLDSSTSVRRDRPGEYRLDPEVSEVIAGLDASRFQCLWFGDEPE